MKTPRGEVAQARNWSKYMLSGVVGKAEYILENNEEILSQHEIDKIDEIQTMAQNLVDNWNKGTEEVLSDFD